MVGNEVKKNYKKTGQTNGLVKSIVLNKIENLNNITDLDLCNRNISSFSEELELPPKIVHLKLSNNKLTEVPANVLNLDNLKILDLSFNFIVFFDDTPSFCHNLESLNLSNNSLEGPPFWVWAEKPKKLEYLNLSNNRHICKSFTNGYFEELLKHTSTVNEINVHNCKITKHVKLLGTLCHAKVIILGNKDYDHNQMNYLEHVPCEGLDKCRDIEQLNLSNTQLYQINSNIDIYKKLKELDLSLNNISSLPNEFSNLENLQTCILSYNKLLYLPDNLCKLSKLVRLILDNNELCMLPETLNEMPSLKTLDLYNNNLCEALDSINNLEELDFAQNYFEEPNDDVYLLKKQKLRIKCLDRVNGRKPEVLNEDSDCSSETSLTEDEELYAAASEGMNNQEQPNSRASSPEDWDSDDHWIPHYYKTVTPPRSPWLHFVKRKMAEGNFCPMDAHPVSIVELVNYEKVCSPQVVKEVEGQFDDYSSDDS